MHIKTAHDLGALMRDRRTETGLTQQQLADRCGASKRWVVAVEAGKPGAELGMVLRALNALDLTLRAEPAGRRGAAELESLFDELDAEPS